jgi:hypothetical protein
MLFRVAAGERSAYGRLFVNHDDEIPRQLLGTTLTEIVALRSALPAGPIDPATATCRPLRPNRRTTRLSVRSVATRPPTLSIGRIAGDPWVGARHWATGDRNTLILSMGPKRRFEVGF